MTLGNRNDIVGNEFAEQKCANEEEGKSRGKVGVFVGNSFMYPGL